MKIYVIRHGLTELNKQNKVNGQIDEPLSSEGIEQAKSAISQIPESIKYIYSSPLKRAKHTAEIVNSKLKRPIYSTNSFAEIHMGSLAGKSWEEMEDGLNLKTKHRSVQFDYRPMGGELASEVKKRVLKFLKEIKTKHKDNEVLIVTHGGIIRFLYLLEQNKIVNETEKHVSILTFDLNKILKNQP